MKAKEVSIEILGVHITIIDLEVDGNSLNSISVILVSIAIIVAMATH